MLNQPRIYFGVPLRLSDIIVFQEASKYGSDTLQAISHCITDFLFQHRRYEIENDYW